ncbi:HAD phosphatase, family IIIA [Elsinoe australis]|uniref:HAD phosphatase, family IIIA n=1 Tax=Elsinoe australis TaxID=40998 RepID=A0A2P7Z400_9PEZI|nr:HAD phosphatase, family IIIA [Elsinoe australis]
MSLNLSGTLNVFKLLLNPSLCLPQATVSTFNDLPVPLSKAFKDSEKVDIRAVVLDKDNCFAVPHQNDVFGAYKAGDRFHQLRQEYPGKRLLIVSNSAGTLADPTGKDAELLEHNTGLTVLRHRTKKPGCGAEIQKYFQTQADLKITSPSQIAVVGDRLFTDAMLANMMGARAIWIRDGVVEDRNIFARAEKSLASFLLRRGYVTPDPKSSFE